MAVTNRLRTEGTANLLAVAERVGARRVVTQSIFLGYGACDHGDGQVTEDHSFGAPTGDSTAPVIAALRSAEEQTFSAPEGIALRYGFFYGGDALQMRDQLEARAIPVAFGGLLPWVHHLDAASATVAALEAGRPGQLTTSSTISLRRGSRSWTRWRPGWGHRLHAACHGPSCA